MEATLEKTQPESGHLVVRPSVLSNGLSKGVGAIRQGTTEKPVRGYGISRDEVGLWIFENLIKLQDRKTSDGVNITY